MLCFHNPGEIDFRLITTLGVNVKEGESPIGFFGTGLKYAIAGLLREGHSITIWSGLTRYSFVVEPQTIRNKEFGFITMIERKPDGALAPGLPLGFTTDLGKTWSNWMFYRELASNVMDEGGTIEAGDFAGFEPQAGGETIIIVTGLDSCHRDRGEIFLQTKPIAIDERLEIHRRDPANGLANYLYYRGVRVADLKQQTLFNYNITQKTMLTEDRTLKDMWSARYTIATAMVNLAALDNISTIETILLAPNGSFESEFDFDTSWENGLFDETIERLMKRHLGQINPSALARIKAKRGNIEPEVATMTKVEQQQLALAKDFLSRVLNIWVESPIVVSDSLGEGIMGLATKKGKIFLSRRAFAQGTKFVASTLVEEWLHAERGLDDCSREFQNELLERLVGLGEELQGRPL